MLGADLAGFQTPGDVERFIEAAGELCGARPAPGGVALFAALKRNPRANQISDFEKLAVQIGLDSGTFNRCLESQQHKEALLREDIQARDDGINATPTVLINGQRYQGRFDPAEFRAAVEQALQEAGS
jgi:trehalose-6-phosphate synthase